MMKNILVFIFFSCFCYASAQSKIVKESVDHTYKITSPEGQKEASSRALATQEVEKQEDLAIKKESDQKSVRDVASGQEELKESPNFWRLNPNDL